MRFQAGLARSLRLKEWRLLIRDPGLFAQLSLQIIYTIPVVVIVLRSEVVPPSIALVPAIVLIAAQVTGSIAWLTVSGEDAPELIATAPVCELTVARAKLGAVALPMLVILAAPLLALAVLSFAAALLALVLAGAAGASTALLNLWHPMPGNRRGMLRRHQQSKLIGLLEHGLAVLWAFASIFALFLSPLAGVPLVVVAAILIVVRARHRRRQANGGATIGRSSETLAGASPSSLPADST
jgi:ABC-2 type transport system permease protein